MLRADAVTRIQDGLGFATRREGRIISRLQEAQDDLESGKTLPKFLLQEAQTLTLGLGLSTVALPTRFIRIDDSIKPYFIATGSTFPTFIAVKNSYQDAFQANFDTTPGTPKVAVIRKSVIDFIVPADKAYTIYWNYYKGAQILDSNIENEWLADKGGRWWLIGEAGYRIAKDARDKDATVLFDDMRKQGRAATFGETLADEDSAGPYVMGANL